MVRNALPHIDPASVMSHIALKRILHVRHWTALLAGMAVLALSGCAFSPGVYMTAARPATQPEPVAPEGITLISITPNLIREQRTTRPQNSAEQVAHLFDAPRPYRIGASDVLHIMVWGHPDLSPAATTNTDTTGYAVNSDGFIQFPFIGQLKVAGLSETQVRQNLAKQLSKYIKNPELTVKIQSYRAGRVYIDGEVGTPGLQIINDIPMTLPEALARAGGLGPKADRSAIAITRNNLTTRVNLPQLTAEGINPNRIMLRSGDLVRVHSAEDAKVFVMGEVLQPRATPLHYGRLNLNEALGESGGINPASADPKQIYVLRSDGGENPQLYHLNGSNPAAYALAEGFELRARDVIYVDPVPLVRWNRVITLLLPSSQAITTTRTLSN